MSQFVIVVHEVIRRDKHVLGNCNGLYLLYKDEGERNQEFWQTKQRNMCLRTCCLLMRVLADTVGSVSATAGALSRTCTTGL